MHQVFEQPLLIRWSHCDAAGIVYHPQYFVIINQLMEDFYRDIAGLGYDECLATGLWFPVVGIRTDFCLPSKLGDRCTAKLWVESIGKTSVRFAVTIEGQDGMRVRCIETAVCARQSEKGLEKCPIPEDVRARMEAYVGAEPLSLRA